MSCSQKVIISLFFSISIFLVSYKNSFAFNCSSNSTGGGNFNIAATWTGCNSTTPQTTDSITINSGDTVTLVATTNIAGITINNGGVLAANTRALTNTDGYTNNGSHTGTTSTMTLSGPSGSIINGNGSYSPTGVVTISTGDKTIASSSQLSFASVTVTAVTLTNNSTAGFSITTALSGTGTLSQGINGTLNLGGTSGITTLTASANPNAVHYIRTTGAQTIHAATYHNLFIDETGQTGTLGGAITVNNDLTITAGNLSDGGFQITGNSDGTLTIPASSTLTLGTTANATSFPTGFSAPHIGLAATSTVNYNSNSAQTISNIPTYGNLTLTATGGVTKTAGGVFSVNGVFTNGTNNTFADGGFTITIKDGVVMTGTHTGTGKLLLTGSSGVHNISGTGSYNNIELDDANGATQSVSTTINGTLTITSGTWTASNTLTVTGITSITGILAITSTTGTKTFGNIIINNGGILSFSATEAMTINGNLTVNGNGAISGTSGVWTFQKIGGGTIGGSASSITILGSLTFATQYSLPATFTVNTMTINSGITETNTGTVTVNTALSGTGMFSQSINSILNLGGTLGVTTLDASANPNSVHYTSVSANQTVKATTYYNLFLDKPGRTGTMNGTTNILGNFISNADTTDFSASFVTITGTTDIYGILKDQNNTGLVTFNGLLTMYSTSSWSGNPGEACNFTFHNGFEYDGGTFVSGTGNFTFDTNNQSIGGVAISINNLVVAGIELTSSAPLTINTTLTLGSGKIINGTNKIILAAAATISRTTGYVIGTVEKNFNTDSTFTFPIGDTINYTPIDLTLKGVTNNSTIDGNITSGNHLDIFNSGIDVNQSVNRYWTLTNNGLNFASYDVSFNYSFTSSMTIAKKSSGIWSILSSTCGLTTCSTTGLTSMSDFQIGVPTTTSSSSSSSSSISSTTIPKSIVPLLPNAGEITPVNPTTAIPIPNPNPSSTPALLDVVSSPLFPDTGSFTVFPLAVSLFSIGVLLGFIFIMVKRRRNKIKRSSRVSKVMLK